MTTSIFSKLYNHRVAIFAAVFALALLCVPFSAMAEEAEKGGEEVAWDKGLKSLVEVISGPTALYISMIGLFFAGGILIFGGELGSFTRMVMMVVLVGSMLTGISSLITRFLSSGCMLL